MTKDWYDTNGFDVSVDQPNIDRAEDDVKRNYILPILPNATTDDDCIRRCVANLTVMLLMRRSLKVTRKGLKVDSEDNSTNASIQDALHEQANVCAAEIKRLRSMPNANARAKVNDICEINFKTHLFGK